MKEVKLTLLFSLIFVSVFSQIESYWQQKVDYNINVTVNVENYNYTGSIKLKYQNNSPDTLRRAFFHLYLNAFQPGSEMDVRQRSLPDPDSRIGDRILKLNDDEIGFQKILQFSQGGRDCSYNIEGTVMEVDLAKAIAPGKSSEFYINFVAQLPKQVRRSGRNNSEGVALSMTQWYPKIAEYDIDGWHVDPYIAREFFGVYGTFDVKINIDKNYVIGGTGVLQNPDEIGHGYSKLKIKSLDGSALTWHFKAENVHDFAWAADPDFKHDILKLNDKTDLHFIYKKGSKVRDSIWGAMSLKMIDAFNFMNKNFGEYPYSDFTVIQGGDGGMEYPMCTLILGDGTNLEGIVGLAVHETLHSWYYGVIGTNEQDYPWMDEGFTTWAEDLTMDYLYPKDKNIYRSSYGSYLYMLRKKKDEVLSTKADFYKTNLAYGVNSYNKGALFLVQLSYIIGDNIFRNSVLEYYNTWKFKHPRPVDFKRILEKNSNINLDWFFNKWINTTDYIDYAIGEVKEDKNKTIIELERIGEVPMPIDLVVTKKNGQKLRYYIPLRIMRGKKVNEFLDKVHFVGNWPWVFSKINFKVEVEKSQIKSIEIDPSQRMADIDLKNNIVEF